MASAVKPQSGKVDVFGPFQQRVEAFTEGVAKLPKAFSPPPEEELKGLCAAAEKIHELAQALILAINPTSSNQIYLVHQDKSKTVNPNLELKVALMPSWIQLKKLRTQNILNGVFPLAANKACTKVLNSITLINTAIIKLKSERRIRSFL